MNVNEHVNGGLAAAEIVHVPSEAVLVHVLDGVGLEREYGGLAAAEIVHVPSEAVLVHVLDGLGLVNEHMNADRLHQESCIYSAKRYLFPFTNGLSYRR